jgi:hypothetical protein
MEDHFAPLDAPGVPDPEMWDLPDHLSWEECLEETAFPARPDRAPHAEDDR